MIVKGNMEPDKIGLWMLSFIFLLAFYGAGNITYKLYKWINNLFGNKKTKIKNRYLE